MTNDSDTVLILERATPFDFLSGLNRCCSRMYAERKIKMRVSDPENKTVLNLKQL